MNFLEINFFSVLLASILAMVVGGIWYSMYLFGKPWMQVIGKTEEELKKVDSTANIGYGLAFISSLVLAMGLAAVLKIAAPRNLFDGLQVGLLVWIVFVLTTNLPHFIFEGRPLKLFAINMGQQLAAILVMCIVLTLWK